MHPRHRVPRRGALQPCQGASTASSRKSWEMFGCRFGRLLLRSRGGAGPEKEEEKPEQTEARQTEGRMRLTAATRTVAGRAPRCRFGGHVRGEFPFALGASRLGFLFSSTGLHTTTHPYIYIDDDDGALYHCPACEGGCDNKWLCPKNKSSSYFRALLGSTRNGRRTPTPWASNQREKSDTHTHTHTHT